jgi:hypothetical protein
MSETPAEKACWDRLETFKSEARKKYGIWAMREFALNVAKYYPFNELLTVAFAIHMIEVLKFNPFLITSSVADVEHEINDSIGKQGEKINKLIEVLRYVYGINDSDEYLFDMRNLTECIDTICTIPVIKHNAYKYFNEELISKIHLLFEYILKMTDAETISVYRTIMQKVNGTGNAIGNSTIHSAVGNATNSGTMHSAVGNAIGNSTIHSAVGNAIGNSTIHSAVGNAAGNSTLTTTGNADSKDSNSASNFTNANQEFNVSDVIGNVANLEIIKTHPLQKQVCFTIYFKLPDEQIEIDKSRLYVVFESNVPSFPIKSCLNDFYNAAGALKGDNVFNKLKRQFSHLMCVEIHSLIALYFYIRKAKGDESYSLVLTQIINPVVLHYLNDRLSVYDHRVKDQYVYAFFKMCEMGGFNLAKLTSEAEIVARMRAFFEENPEYTVCEQNLKTIQMRPRMTMPKLRCLIAEFASPLITKKGSKLKNVFVGGKRKTRRQNIRRRRLTRKSRR